MNTFKIKNKAFRGNIDCFQSLIDISNLAVEEDWTVDFSDFIEATPFNMLLISLGLKTHNQVWGNLKSCRMPKENGYLNYMGFFETCGVQVPKDTRRGTYKKGVYICIKKIKLSGGMSIEADYELIEKEAKKLSSMLDFDEELSAYTNYCFFEMIRNVYEHSETDEVYVCAQYWPTQKIDEIATADAGCGIRNAMEKRYQGTEQELLEKAMFPGLTARSNHQFLPRDDYYRNSGYGLYLTKELALAYDGYFIICSGKYAYKYTQKKTEIINTFFLGTAIGIRFSTDTFKNFQTVRSKIIKEAEKLSKEEKGAIHSASKSSGGSRY